MSVRKARGSSAVLCATGSRPLRPINSKCIPQAPGRLCKQLAHDRIHPQRSVCGSCSRVRYGCKVARAVSDNEECQAAESNVTEVLDVEALVKDTMSTENLGQRGEVLFVGQAALAALAIFTPSVLEDISVFSGYTVILGGAALALAAVKDLGNSLSPFPKPRDDGVLVTTGVYSFVRHPMYAGLLLIVLGTALASSSSARFMLFLALVFLIDAKATREEKYLKEKFGKAWDQYTEDVKKILPFLY